MPGSQRRHRSDRSLVLLQSKQASADFYFCSLARECRENQFGFTGQGKRNND